MLSALKPGNAEGGLSIGLAKSMLFQGFAKDLGYGTSSVTSK